MTGLVPHLYSSMNRFVQYWFNPRWSIGLLAQQLRKQIDESGGQEAKFYESDNPDHLMRLLSGWQLKFEKALYRYAVPFKIEDRRDPKKRGISLREALQPVLDLHSNELTAEWGYWMVAKRAEELMAASEAKLDAIIVLNTADLYYLSASVQTAHLLITPGQDPRLLVRKVLERAREDSPLEHIEPLASMKQLPERIAELCGPPPWRIGMELDVVPAATFAFYSKLLGENTEIVDASGLLLKNRASKSDYEIEELRRAARAQRLVFEAVPEFLSREGISTCLLYTSPSPRD